MAKLYLRQNGESLDIQPDQTLLDCLRKNNVYIKSSCGGVASCSDCIVKIVAGEDNLTPPPFSEIQLLGNVFHITKERLACQCKVEGDVTIDISSHDKLKDEESLRNKTASFSAKTKVRKKSDVDAMYEERQALREQRKSEEPAALEKEGGMRRPKPFISSDD